LNPRTKFKELLLEELSKDIEPFAEKTRLGSSSHFINELLLDKWY
jgi:hypothetical protein